MASGPDHYRAAENLLTQAMTALTSDDPRIGGEGRQMAYGMLVARAQVHATLALAAATIAGANAEWREVLA